MLGLIEASICGWDYKHGSAEILAHVVVSRKQKKKLKKSEVTPNFAERLQRTWKRTEQRREVNNGLREEKVFGKQRRWKKRMWSVFAFIRSWI